MDSPRVSDKLAPSSHAVLALLTLSDHLTGNDFKKLAELGVGKFYWSPSTSQVYTELKKLEQYGLVKSEDISEAGVRGRREYSLTLAGVEEVRRWVNSEDVEPYMLRHGSLLRIWAGALADPARLREIWLGHIRDIEEQLAVAEQNAVGTDGEPAWVFAHLAIRWTAKRYRAELDLAREMLADLDGAIAEAEHIAEIDYRGIPQPTSPRHKRIMAEVLGRSIPS